MEPRGFDEFLGVRRWLPIQDWSVAEVFACHRRHRVAPNPLYSEGMGRVGCFPCIFATKSELRSIAERYPETFDRVAAMERAVGGARERGASSFFACNKTSQAYRSRVDGPTGKRYPDAEDVRRWALSLTPRGAPKQLPLFQEEGEDIDAPTCLSKYGLCE
jgi:3'-phosphoadenosine 5'-phosphosulfate sulfotransferase (PAPS reductase)/FAD synthetase